MTLTSHGTVQPPLRVVIDTSVLLCYLIKPSAAIKELVEVWWLGGAIQLVTATELLAELGDVLSRPTIQTLVRDDEGRVLLDAINLLADTISALGIIPSFSRDPKDDKFIACALAGSAHFLITTDEDLLVLNEIEDVLILTPYHFVALLKNLEG